MNDSTELFLASVKNIDENEAEFPILLSLFNHCPGKDFLLELENLTSVITYRNDLIKYINLNYKAFKITVFKLSSDGSITHEERADRILKCDAGMEVDMINIALNLSMKPTYVLIQSKKITNLFYKGKIDRKFSNSFGDKEELHELEKMKKGINELEWAFKDFQYERMFRSCDYIENGKIKDNISERELRNYLKEYLEKNTKLYATLELCTSKFDDEESVDIGLLDSQGNISIVEVKYFVKRGYFVDPDKSAYSMIRFKHGYEQLGRYCHHLTEENRKLHSAFLYMFYAHSETKDKVIESSKGYLEQYLNGDCAKIMKEKFKNYYKKTIYDNMLEEVEGQHL